MWALDSSIHWFNSADLIKFTIRTFIDEQTRTKCRSTQSTFESNVQAIKSDLNLLIGMRTDIDRQRDWRTLMVSKYMKFNPMRDFLHRKWKADISLSLTISTFIWIAQFPKTSYMGFAKSFAIIKSIQPDLHIML